MTINDDEIEALLNLILGDQAYTPAVTIYLGLLTDDPLSDGTGYTETTYTDYARVSKTNNNTNFPNCTPGTRQKSNGTVITFVEAASAGGSIVGVGVFFGSVGGDCKLYAPLSAPETINTGNIVSFAIGQLKFTSLS
jgi:hypothetical protein